MPSSTSAAHGRKSARRVVQRRYSARFIIGCSHIKMGWDAQMASCSLDKERIALRGPDGSGMTDCPDQEARDPQPQAEAERSGNGAVDDGDRTRRAAEQDRFGQRAVHRNCKTFNRPVHQISTPPPNEKNARKKLEAANAIDRPKTIWIRRRKPPEVSPKASVRPVTMMMITARILATGPSTDCRIWLSGCSHGMLEPAAWAVLTVMRTVANIAVATKSRPRGRVILMICPLLLSGCSRRKFRVL